MFWSLVLPLKITFLLLVVVVLLWTKTAPRRNRTRGQSFLAATILSLVIFVPLSLAVATVVNMFRFGRFEHAYYKDINDPHARFCLPPAATQVTMIRYAGGNCARYSITESDLHRYLDELWSQPGWGRKIKREEISSEGESVSREELESIFGPFELEPLENAVCYHGPLAADGAGAVYYFDAKSGITLQRTGYW